MTKPLCASLLVLIAAGSFGCGNWSNDDIAFTYAFPSKDALEAVVPASTSTSQSGLQTRKDGLGLGDPSESYGNTVAKAKEFNAGLLQFLAVLDFVRKQAPSKRSADSRTWGPWNDQSDRTRELRIVIDRFDEDGGLHYEWSIQIKRKTDGDDAWLKGVTGQFLPSEDVRVGTGSIAFDAKKVRDAGFAGPTDDAHLQRIDVNYATDREPKHVDMAIVADNARLDYAYDERSDHSGAMTFEISANWYGSPLSPETMRVTSAWTQDGAGRADFKAFGGDLSAYGTREDPLNAGEECWDVSFRTSYLRQRWDANGNRLMLGDESDCAIADPDGDDNTPPAFP